MMLISIGIVFKTPILQSFSNFLMHQNEPEKVDLMVVLSGGAYDRGNEAVRLFRQGLAPLIVCPGGNLQHDFLIVGDTVYESDLTKKNIVKGGIPDSLVRVLKYGTSTIEEADTILGYCKENQIKKIMVVSNLFHTRRAGKVYRKKFDKEGITVLMRGCHDSQFDEDHWWQNEYGLIGLNNEYMKTLYYFLKRK